MFIRYNKTIYYSLICAIRILFYANGIFVKLMNQNGEIRKLRVTVIKYNEISFH